MPAKRAQLAVKRVDSTDTIDAVCDYDELDEALRDELGDFAGAGETTLTVDSFVAALADTCEYDVVHFTDYYRISRV